MVQNQALHDSLPSSQPSLNTAYGLSRFCGFYYLTGLITRIANGNRPYWELVIQDAFDSVAVFSDEIEPIIKQLSPFTPIQVECVRRRFNDKYYFVADMLNPVTDIPGKIRRVSLIPYSAAISGNDLSHLIDCVANVDFAPLRQFIERVLMQSNVMVPFVRNPASLRFHHNAPGGLLSHSLAVASLISKEFIKGTIECDIAKTAALLHDIGKTQTLSDNLSRTAIGSIADHDALTLEICAEPLAQLSQNHPHVANQLRHAWTCASPNARYGFKAKTRVAKQLQRADNQNAKC
jgi:3'-5' exoribonuclease